MKWWAWVIVAAAVLLVLRAGRGGRPATEANLSGEKRPGQRPPNTTTRAGALAAIFAIPRQLVGRATQPAAAIAPVVGPVGTRLPKFSLTRSKAQPASGKVAA